MESARALQAETASIAVREGGDWVTRYAFGYDDDVLGSRFTDTDLPHVALAAGTRAPVAISHAGEDDRTSLAAVKLLRLRSVLAVPLVAKDEVNGVLLFNWHDRRVSLTSAQVDFAAKLATAVSLSLDNARLYAERNESVRLAEALNHIGVAINAADGIDAIAQILAGEGMRVLGCEAAVASLAEGDEFVTRVAQGAAGPLLGERFPQRRQPHHGRARARPRAPRRQRRRHDAAPGAGLCRALRPAGAARRAPCRARAGDRRAGLRQSRRRRPPSPKARRASPRRWRRRARSPSRTSASTRSSTAPPRPCASSWPVPSRCCRACCIGATHRAAAAAERVGGDFFDVFALDERTVALFIADVSGKGVPAAGFTETIRSAVRAVAYLDRSPAFVLDHVNQSLMRQVTGGPTETLFATASLHIIDLATGDVRYASAGHPPTVVCGERCDALPTVPGVPLGTFDRPHTEQVRRLAPGEVLVAYTDGITEARRGKELFGDERLLAALAGGSRDPQELVDRLLAAAMEFAGGDLTDDAAVIGVALVADAAGAPRR